MKSSLYRQTARGLHSLPGTVQSVGLRNTWVRCRYGPQDMLPMQNGHVESFNGRLPAEYLNVSWFHNLGNVRTAAWTNARRVCRDLESSINMIGP
jgi:transposase InsO family protein